MCTLSWARKKSSEGTGSYALLFNRDEQRARPPAEPPKIHDGGSGNWISATDPKGGGTWLACNEFGLSVALLNSYESVESQEDQSAESFRSRGLLVRDLVERCGEISAATEWLNQFAGEALYRPFYLAVFDMDEDVFWHWNGNVFEAIAPDGFMTSSSYQPESVVPFRARQYSLNCDLESFHRQHDPENTVSSVLMSRPDAATVSLSKIEVGPETGISYRYAEGPHWKWQNPVLLPFSLS